MCGPDESLIEAEVVHKFCADIKACPVFGAALMPAN
jgi:hypothetical protein